MEQQANRIGICLQKKLLSRIRKSVFMNKEKKNLLIIIFVEGELIENILITI